MKLTPREAWIVCRLLGGRLAVAPGSNTPLEESDRIYPLTARLALIDPPLRIAFWKGFVAAQEDADDWLASLGEAHPELPPPPEEAPAAGVSSVSADLGDVRRMITGIRWTWAQWLACGVLNTLASNPGEGKTILAMNLARVLWEGRPWPDGAVNANPPGTRTLWIPADRHYPQLIDLADRYGLPDAAMRFNAPPSDPAGNHDLDDRESLDALKASIEETAPGLVIVDTVGMTTRRSLGKPEEAREYFAPLMDIAGKYSVPFLLITHLSKDSQALGRRIVGASRLVWKLTKPDPENHPDRRRFWVDKTYELVPKPLGMTIGPNGCTFDHDPPSESRDEPRPRRGNRLHEVKEWLADRLAAGPVLVADLSREAREAGFGFAYLYKAREMLGIEELGVKRSLTWKLSLDDAD